MSIVHTHALNYSEVESRKNIEMDSNIGYYTFRNDNHHHNQKRFSASTSSEMETMFTNSQHFSVKQEEKNHFSHELQYENGYSCYASSSNQMIYQTQQNHELQNDYDGSFSAVNSLDSENYITETKIGSTSNCSNLIRQKSSPAEFFSNYSYDNVKVGSVRSFDVSKGQATTSTTGLHSFTNDYWDSSIFNVPKTSTNNGEIIFSTSNAFETQDLDFGYQKLGLSHHLSLPSSSTKMTSMDKFFHIQGSVPCKIRAKRGFATHPRSIAERERRIRISARIKKLQELFPNSDKQSSTADMLDVAVEYIKDLRKQLKILSDTKAKCSCTSN